MAHLAKLNENNIVTFVTVARDEDEFKELEISQQTGEKYRRTSYNTRGGIHYNPNTNLPSDDQSKAFRKNYAGIGYTYDEVLDAFIPPQPYPSWLLDTNTCNWYPPVPYPNDGNMYQWDEATQQWVLFDPT